MKFLLGKKLAMSQLFDEEGNVIPVTLVKSGPCFVTQLKSKEKDGYRAIQIGFEKLKEKKVKKTAKGKPFRYLREFQGETKNYKIGDEIKVSIFEEGELVDISGTSKGKGFAGAVKKWGFHGRPRTRGTKHELRGLGSIGASTPSRVIKGKKMPGRMGSERITAKNLKIVRIDKEKGILFVKGALPGRRGSLLEIKGKEK